MDSQQSILHTAVMLSVGLFLAAMGVVMIDVSQAITNPEKYIASSLWMSTAIKLVIWALIFSSVGVLYYILGGEPMWYAFGGIGMIAMGYEKFFAIIGSLFGGLIEVQSRRVGVEIDTKATLNKNNSSTQKE